MSAGQETLHVIDGPAGRLAVRILMPDEPARGHALICHPHPLHGGSMDNKVVYTLSRLLGAHGYITARFNFRGVGQSEGQFDQGIGETADAEAVLAFLRAQHPLPSGAELALAGFSFGGFVAARACEAVSANRLITVAPAVTRFDFSTFARPTCPWLIVMGDADEVVEPQAVFDWAAGLPANARLLRFDGAGHYFHGRLIELRERLDAALKD